MKKPVIDSQTCIGCGTCAAICPGTFTVTGPTASVTNPMGNTEEEVNAAIASCPGGAISIVEVNN